MLSMLDATPNANVRCKCTPPRLVLQPVPLFKTNLANPGLSFDLLHQAVAVEVVAGS